MANKNRTIYDTLGNAYILTREEHLQPKWNVYQYNIDSNSWRSLRYNISSFRMDMMYDIAVLKDGTVILATDEGLYMLKTDITNVTGIPVNNSLTAELYPTPAVNDVTLLLYGAMNEEADVTLCSITGNVLKKYKVKREYADKRVHNIDIRDLPAGLFLLGIRTDSKNMVIPLLKK